MPEQERTYICCDMKSFYASVECVARKLDPLKANLLVATKGVPGEIYNVASGKTYTILELVDMIEKITGYTFTRQVRPKRAGDLHDSAANISKISTLGFVPSGSLEQGLREMWAEKTAKTSN